jgi:cytochrome oxidase Cu insertion factor (SCO1/SenC/PrrC family)
MPIIALCVSICALVIATIALTFSIINYINNKPQPPTQFVPVSYDPQSDLHPDLADMLKEEEDFIKAELPDFEILPESLNTKKKKQDPNDYDLDEGDYE